MLTVIEFQKRFGLDLISDSIKNLCLIFICFSSTLIYLYIFQIISAFSRMILEVNSFLKVCLRIISMILFIIYFNCFISWLQWDLGFCKIIGIKMILPRQQWIFSIMKLNQKIPFNEKVFKTELKKRISFVEIVLVVGLHL